MIIWINGAFGSGKSTLAKALHEHVPDALPFDPEYVGYILTKWAPPASTGDFQDIRLWRKLVANFAVGLAEDYGKSLIVPMTLVNSAYRQEIFDRIQEEGHRILHVFLDAPADELHRRIEAQIIHPDNADADADAREFRHSNVERCIAARAQLPPETLILRSDELSPAELATLVLEAVAHQPRQH